MSLSPRVRRSVTVLGVTAGLVGAFAAGTAVTGGDDPGSETRPRPRGGTDASPVAFTGSNLSLAESCDELLDWYVARGVDRVGPCGWDYGYGYGRRRRHGGRRGGHAERGRRRRRQLGRRAALDASRHPHRWPSTSRVENDDSGTNVQELGVDEPDVVKTDGRTLFRVEGNDLVTYDVTGAEVERIGSADLVDLRYGEILLTGDTVVAIGSSAAGGKESYDGRDADPGGRPRRLRPVRPGGRAHLPLQLVHPRGAAARRHGPAGHAGRAARPGLRGGRPQRRARDRAGEPRDRPRVDASTTGCRP